MRVCLWLVSVVVVLGSGAGAFGQDDVHAVIDKALKAHGGEARLTQLHAGQFKTRGTLALGDGAPFQQVAFFQVPGAIKEVLQLDIAGKKTVITTVYDGDKGWLNIDGNTRELDGRSLKELKEMAHFLTLTRLARLKDKTYDLSALGEFQIEGRTLVGICVAANGYRDVNLYFDKETGLLNKSERRSLDLEKGQEISEERMYSNFQESNGVVSPRKVVVRRDGKKFMESAVTEARFLEKLDDSVFAKP